MPFRSGNDTALAQLLTREAPQLADAWQRTWDLEGESVKLAPAVTAENPLLAAMLALHKESCRLLYASGAGTDMMWTAVPVMQHASSQKHSV